MIHIFRRILNRLRAGNPRDRREGSSDGTGDSGADSDAIRTDGGESVSATSTPTVSVSTRIRRLFQDERVAGLLFWVPPFLLMGWFVYGAIGWNVVISLTDWSGLGQPLYDSFDLGMYRDLLSDPSFKVAARNQVVLMISFTVAALGLGLLLAIMIDQNIRFENTFRTVYLLPMALSFVVTAIFWSWLYNADIGLINQALETVGLGAVALDWLGNPRTKLAAIIVALTWQFSGYCMIVYLAALRAIPNEHYEAAKVDGASTFRMYWRVIVPQLRSATTSATVVLMVFALKAFDFIFVMFGDTPGPSADILSVMMFREAFSRSNWAYGSAVATVLFLLALAIVVPYLYTQHKRGDL
ncbi:carbohydrate ABC transporter permease [Natronoarchaeum sp. GCM10025321]|uniref:carbohydrate ABC transporter permease n=2 Tax=unclassified Natronoarchaeum TaxID=2620183 RepID=UPI00360CADE7